MLSNSSHSNCISVFALQVQENVHFEIFEWCSWKSSLGKIIAFLNPCECSTQHLLKVQGNSIRAGAGRARWPWLGLIVARAVKSELMLSVFEVIFTPSWLVYWRSPAMVFTRGRTDNRIFWVFTIMFFADWRMYVSRHHLRGSTHGGLTDAESSLWCAAGWLFLDVCIYLFFLLKKNPYECSAVVCQLIEFSSNMSFKGTFAWCKVLSVRKSVQKKLMTLLFLLISCIDDIDSLLKIFHRTHVSLF